jgi:type I restriction-modification system DNA methylase subunit
MNGFDKGFERDDERTIILAKANMLIYLSDVIFKYPKLTGEFSKQFNDTFTLFRDNLGTFKEIIEDEKQKYDYILTNPPYVTRGAGIIKEEIKSKHLEKYYPINSRGLEGLAIEWIIRSLVGGGRRLL